MEASNNSFVFESFLPQKSFKNVIVFQNKNVNNPLV